MDLLERAWDGVGNFMGSLMHGFERSVTSVFGTSNARYIRKLQTRVESINALEERYQAMSDAELRAQTVKFRERLKAALPDVRVAGPPVAPLGFYQLHDDELFQLYVSAEARGSGVAAGLIADAEARLAEQGVEVAWLACAIGNERAARFYEKSGWVRAGIVIDETETSAGPFPLEVWRYEKRLRAGA